VPSIKYSIETEVGLFNSTLTLPEGHTYTDDEIEQLKQAYADAYVIEMQIAEKTSVIKNLKQIEVMRSRSLRPSNGNALLGSWRQRDME
jgi:uncharacterized protein Veg